MIGYSAKQKTESSEKTFTILDNTVNSLTAQMKNEVNGWKGFAVQNNYSMTINVLCKCHWHDCSMVTNLIC